MNTLKLSSCDLIKFLKEKSLPMEICDLLEGKIMFNSWLIFECAVKSRDACIDNCVSNLSTLYREWN